MTENIGMAGSIASEGLAAGAQRTRFWRAAFWTVWAALLVVKLVLAATLAPFGDEAWYWQESRALDWSYSDLPPATAWLIRCGETLFGHGVLAMRSVFLMLGAAVPIVLLRTAARLFGARTGWQAGLLALALPLLGTLGLFALPDTPLTLASIVALDALERCVRTQRRRDWLVLGIVLAFAWLCHYRAAMLLLTGLVFFVTTARGRAAWRGPGLWIALAISSIGLVPLLIYNIEHAWVALGFQFVERNPWTFHADGLVQPAEQALVCTPLFYVALLWAAWKCWRRTRDGVPWDLLAVCALVPILGYFVLGCFADDTRLRLHWPLPGYLPLLIALPILWREWMEGARRGTRRALLAATIATLALGTGAVFAYFVAAATPGGAIGLARVKAFPEHWVGWNEVSAQTREILAQPRFAAATLVADNFMLAAELDFAFDGTRAVFTLDHPLNAKHGRAPQLAEWRRDEAALRALGGAPLLLVAEPTTRRERERAAWLASLCQRVDNLVDVGKLELYAGRKRYLFFAANARSAGADAARAGDCPGN